AARSDSTRIVHPMPENMTKSLVRVGVEDALRGGLARAYETVRVDPVKFLVKLRTAYGLPITTFHGVYSVELSSLDSVSQSLIRGGMKVAAAEGAGLGLGGIITIVPDLGILAGIPMRTIQDPNFPY